MTLSCAAGTLLVLAAHAAQAPQWRAPRNEWGQPDLQGTWNNATITPYERPVRFGERRALSEEEAQQLEKAEQKFVETSSEATNPALGVEEIPNQCRPGFSDANCGYNTFWVDMGYNVVRIDGEPRSSILTLPSSGRMPSMKPEAANQQREQMAALRGRGVGSSDGPEGRSLGERCIMSFGSSAGPPMLPSMYNNNYQIVQNQDHVIILVEMIHDVRVVRLGGKALPEGMKRWMGDSVGRYEGDTLVVETSNINPAQAARGSPQRKVTERFTRVARDRIKYEFQVEDPAMTEPYGGALTFNATADHVYEYACHEGNYALPGILAGAREQERAAGPTPKGNNQPN